MSKISYYPSADEPLQLSDRLIGTEAPRIPASPTPLATKNFSLGELLDLFSSNFPAASLQAVLNTGNTATQNITLVGTITSTVIKPTNIEDTSGSQGTTFQVLSKGTSSINWINIPVDNLQAVLNAGSVATGNITLTGDITSTKIIPGNIQDDTAGIGTVGQVLSKTSTGIRWITNPAFYTAGLADVLSVGNIASTSIFIEDDKYSTEINTAYVQVLDLNLGSYAYLGGDGSLGLGNGINGALLKTTNVTQSIILEFPNKPSGTYTIATTSDSPLITPAAMTKVDDTNVTLTLGGSPSTSLLAAVTLILGWTGTLADSRIASASTWNAKAKLTQLGTQTLAFASWSLSGGYYIYTFSNVNITATSVVDFTPDNASINEVSSCRMLPQVDVASGSCTFYATFPPQSNITGTINVWQ